MLESCEHGIRLWIARRKLTLDEKAFFILGRKRPLADRQVPPMSEEHLRHTVGLKRLLIGTGKNHVAITILAVENRSVATELSRAPFYHL